MVRYWEPKGVVWAKRIGGYCGLLLLWLGISVGLHLWEKTGVVFKLAPVFECKILAVALLFAGRYLLFPCYRLAGWKRWIFCGALIGLGACGFPKLAKDLAWQYAGLVFADTLFWAGIATGALEVCGGVYRHWYQAFGVYDGREFEQLWRHLWLDSVQWGIWLTLVLGLSFFYLIQFYWLEVITYSRIFAGALVVAELVLILIGYGRYRQKLEGEIARVDYQLHAYLKWNEFDSDRFWLELPRFQYLLLSREVLMQRRRVGIRIGAIGGWGLCSGFLLSLPQLIGIVMKV